MKISYGNNDDKVGSITIQAGNQILYLPAKVLVMAAILALVIYGVAQC